MRMACLCFGNLVTVSLALSGLCAVACEMWALQRGCIVGRMGGKDPPGQGMWAMLVLQTGQVCIATCNSVAYTKIKVSLPSPESREVSAQGTKCDDMPDFYSAAPAEGEELQGSTSQGTS